jgi:FMN phosphatase YigB (HAD superfamily)
MALSAKEVLFLDDSTANVTAARTLGMKAHILKNTEEVRLVLQSCGVLTMPSALT